jgi:hypothetical protein
MLSVDSKCLFNIRSEPEYGRHPLPKAFKWLSFDFLGKHLDFTKKMPRIVCKTNNVILYIYIYIYIYIYVVVYLFVYLQFI